MTELYGWWGIPCDGHSTEALLQHMGGDHRNKTLTIRAQRGACAASESRLTALPNGVVAAITGTPRWSDSRLERIASERGHGYALAEAYRLYDSSLLRHLHGAFAFVVLDEKAGRILAAVDRIGQESLHYASADGGLVFGSSAGNVRAHPSVGTALAPQAIFNYVYFHMVPSPGAVYADQYKLPGGHYLEFDGTDVRTGAYWEPDFCENDSVDLEALGEEMRALIGESVRRLSPEGEVGAFLSGGLDSSTIAGELAKLRPGGAHTYSIGFSAPGYDEIPYARIAARHFGTLQHEYYVTPDDVAEAAPSIAQAYDEPFGNSSAVAVYYCAKLAAADGVQRMLAGDGGDELFAGNGRYARQSVFRPYLGLPLWLRRGLLEPILFRLPDAGAAFRKAKSYVKQANTPLPDRLETYNFLNREGVKEIFKETFLACVDIAEPLRLQRSRYDQLKEASALNRMMYLDWQHTLADNDLRKVGRMCALAGVDAAYPLLDDRIISLSCKIPSHWKLRGRDLRYFYKQAMSNTLPAETIAKPKHGFGLPFGVWLQSDRRLRELAWDSLGALKRREYLRPEFLDEAIRRHREHHAIYYGELIWILVMLELWLEAHGH